MRDLWLVGVLVLIAVSSGLWGLLAMRRAARQRLRDLVERPLQPPPEQARLRPERLRRRWARQVAGLWPGSAVEDVRWRLLWAGRPVHWSAEEFVAFRVALALAAGVLLPATAAGARVGGAGLALLLGLSGAVAGIAIPDAWLNVRIQERRRRVRAELPLFLDLVAAAIEAGASLSEAVLRVAEELPGLTAAEFMRSLHEMGAGKPRQAAWRDLMDRTPSPELKAVVLSIIQAERYGTSVADQLRAQVQTLRAERQRRAQEMAQAAAVKMRIPMRALNG